YCQGVRSEQGRFQTAMCVFKRRNMNLIPPLFTLFSLLPFHSLIHFYSPPLSPKNGCQSSIAASPPSRRCNKSTNSKKSGIDSIPTSISTCEWGNTYFFEFSISRENTISTQYK